MCLSNTLDFLVDSEANIITIRTTYNIYKRNTEEKGQKKFVNECNKQNNI